MITVTDTNGVHTIRVIDPGAPHRMGVEAVREFDNEIKVARRAQSSVVLISVQSDAWATSAPTPDSTVAALHQCIQHLYALDTPVVVHLDGQVTGAGLGLALASDLRVASSRTTVGLGDPAEAEGLAGGAAWLLRDRVGSALHEHLMWTGETLDVSTAHAFRLVSAIGDVGDATAHAERLSHLPPTTLSALKRSTRVDVAEPLRTRLNYDQALHVVVDTDRK